LPVFVNLFIHFFIWTWIRHPPGTDPGKGPDPKHCLPVHNEDMTVERQEDETEEDEEDDY
jgi:hypothetical protein